MVTAVTASSAYHAVYFLWPMAGLRQATCGNVCCSAERGMCPQGWSVSGAAGALMAMHAATGLGQLLLPSNVVVQHFEASQASVLKRPWTLLTSIFCPTGPIDLLVSLQVQSCWSL